MKQKNFPTPVYIHEATQQTKRRVESNKKLVLLNRLILTSWCHFCKIIILYVWFYQIMKSKKRTQANWMLVTDHQYPESGVTYGGSRWASIHFSFSLARQRLHSWEDCTLRKVEIVNGCLHLYNLQVSPSSFLSTVSHCPKIPPQTVLIRTDLLP